MASDVFADMVRPAVYTKPQTVVTKPVEQKENVQPVEISKKQKVLNAAKTAAPIVLPLVAIPLTALVTYKISAQNTNQLKKQLDNMSNELKIVKKSIKTYRNNGIKASETLKQSITNGEARDAKIWAVLLGLVGMTGSYQAGKLSDKDKEDVAKKADENRVNQNDTISSLCQSVTSNFNNLGKKYTVNHYGIQLLKNNIGLSDKLKKELKDVGNKYLLKPPTKKPINSETPCLWSVTSEFEPIKEGGLGSVPVALQKNIEKLGVKLPTFIPMYQDKGIASFSENKGKYYYQYKGNIPYELKKIASFKVDAFQGGKSKPENVEIFMADDNGKQLIFIKNDKYFNGSIYSTGIQSEEPEKFAFFSKVVYELAKLRESIDDIQINELEYDEKNNPIIKKPSILKDLVLNDEDAFRSIPKMDGFLLNDWQASPIAALARYKAPVEGEFGEISSAVADKFKNINIITIGHNAMYQGSTQNNNDQPQRRESTANILNTLFDKYTYDIVCCSESGAPSTNKSDGGLRRIDNVLLLNETDEYNNHVNLLNMGITLSDYFCPVSKNYAKELVSPERPDLSYELQWALTQKDKSKSLIGIINGNDFNTLSIEAKKGKIKGKTTLDFETYNKQSSIDEIMLAREHNKSNFYNNYIIPISTIDKDKENKYPEIKKILETDGLKFIDTKGDMEIPKLTDEELKNTPIIASCGRLVSQKGIDIMCDAIAKLYENWDTDFPGKNKPIFYLAGDDNPDDKQSPEIIKLKTEKLSKENSDRVIFAKGYAPMPAMTSASDFFLMSSKFEPCGLTQSESLALGTPVIASAVGGIVDTLNRGKKNNAVLTDEKKMVDADQLYTALKNGLNIYFNEPDHYKQMVRDSIDEDFSWIKGPCQEYLDLAGIPKDKIKDVN